MLHSSPFVVASIGLSPHRYAAHPVQLLAELPDDLVGMLHAACCMLHARSSATSLAVMSLPPIVVSFLLIQKRISATDTIANTITYQRKERRDSPKNIFGITGQEGR